MAPGSLLSAMLTSFLPGQYWQQCPLRLLAMAGAVTNMLFFSPSCWKYSCRQIPTQLSLSNKEEESQLLSFTMTADRQEKQLLIFSITSTSRFSKLSQRVSHYSNCHKIKVTVDRKSFNQHISRFIFGANL